MNIGMNTGMNMVNNPQPQPEVSSNQPRIKENQNAPDTGYGGGGINHEFPKDVAHGSSGIAQNNLQNTQFIQGNNTNNLNNMNNINVNNQEQNARNEVQNNIQVNNNENNNNNILNNNPSNAP